MKLESDCDVCGRERETDVAASPLGPVSLAYCSECLERGAMDAALLRSVFEGPEDLTSDMLEYGTTFVDGEYKPAAEAWGD